ncbi:hypothetical protein FO440_16390 [Mucilaginibacter corticis]|uniref:Uncharacterized protein n=1 Tax=Mucilaginibacter corticis TaxID=2597670 RepID=A0A556MHF6_9SPHI|nr:hypothetical protein [Mucilaginibacter corticis]TSJ39328.1 hypothetical protein FO440_16390 [Mucilaginibacter corticis]
MKKSVVILLALTICSSIACSQQKNKTNATSKDKTPCMDVLNLFTAANVPAMASEEELAPLSVRQRKPRQTCPETVWPNTQCCM